MSGHVIRGHDDDYNECPVGFKILGTLAKYTSLSLSCQERCYRVVLCMQPAMDKKRSNTNPLACGPEHPPF